MAVGFVPSTVLAAVTVSLAGPSYNQNFDSLASTGTTNAWVAGTTLPGWHWSSSTNATPATYTATPGTVAQNVVLSAGIPGDRAFGGQNSSSAGHTIYFGLGLTNATGMTHDGFTLSYNGEQWRAIAGAGVDKLTFEYQVFAAGAGSITASGTWTSVSALDFFAPFPTPGTSTPVDGNDDGRVALSGGVVSGLGWDSGEELWLRWTDTTTGSGGSLAMMTVDDVAFAVPEPQRAVLLLLGVAFAGLHRRRVG
ncbi:hypothetical protein [Phragmitibacter flavus]|uniref:hypothetical protein n=1 Tax=Phragmitibacter flavus TaxID=2576071 RepID=UPI0010FE79A2|nr:hypothetical protein [Phragmitibacter flavus]